MSNDICPELLFLPNEICPVCLSSLLEGYSSWHFECPTCGYEKANLQPLINVNSAHQMINENARETGLHKLRVFNFQILLNKINSLKPLGGRLLEVGSAHGWFLEMAQKHFDVVGLEPDRNICEATLDRGLPIRMGYFPEVLDQSDSFDVIVFNDVIEHIADINSILLSCHQRLNEEGLLVLNLPSSAGIFYRLSKIFYAFGFAGFFERLWQKGLPSPHLHYFNQQNLTKLLEGSGFDVVTASSLSTLHLSGLYTRLSYTSNLSFPIRIIMYVSIVLSLPLLKIFPKDIIFNISRKRKV